MKLLFVHDHPFFKEKNAIYSGGSFPGSLWLNYLLNFYQIIVFGRNSSSVKSKVVLSSLNENVCFHLTDNYDSLKGVIKNYSKLRQELSILIDDVDVVLVRLPSLLGIVAAFIAFKKNKKVWVEVVGNAKEAMHSHGSLLGKLSGLILDELVKHSVRKANYVSYVTQSKLQHDYPINNDVITASISNVIIDQIVEKNKVDLTRFTSSIFKIGLIGGFNVRYKGQDVLLNAISTLPNHIKINVQLFFVGIGDSKWIMDLAKELGLGSNIKFIGSKESGGPVFSLLNEMSLYIQPSLTEGMPRALLEAMSTGCPVMGSRVGGIPDVVNEDLLHNKGDFETIALQIEKLYLNRKLLVDESSRSLKVVEPYLKVNLDKSRNEFYKKMNQDIHND